MVGAIKARASHRRSMRVWKEAEAAWEAGRWAEAGEGFAAIAQKAARVRERRQCREAAERAIDAFRRDDRPAAAARMARLALDHGAEPVVLRVQLAAVLLDAGQAQAARDLSAEAATLPSEPGTQALAHDTACGMALAAGDIDGARAQLAALQAMGLPGADIAARFRRGQLARLDGDVDGAEALFLALALELEPHPGPCGAAWAEVGELRLLRVRAGGTADAMSAFAASSAAWTRAGRRAGMMRGEAWALRARRELGEAVHSGAVQTVLVYARERGLVLMEADLLVALAILTDDPAPASAAVALCAEAPLARGRARLEAAGLGGPLDVEAAMAELAPDKVHRALLLVERGRREGDAGLSDEGRVALRQMFGAEG
jgi:hypothetical protein